ncbi:MAG TPA: alcohol dehydrogenase catalytic domain-containing protein, partial [Pseudonocardiaceae bacterium]
MRATLLYGAGDVRVENVADPVVAEPTDALVRVTAACICGSDLWPYAAMPAGGNPARMGHEFIGVVEDTGSDVICVKNGDVVVAPWVISDGTCEFCREGRYSSCDRFGRWGMGPYDG